MAHTVGCKGMKWTWFADIVFQPEGASDGSIGRLDPEWHIERYLGVMIDTLKYGRKQHKWQYWNDGKREYSDVAF